MLVKLDALIDDLQRDFDGLGETVLLQAINRAARTLCIKSSVWRDYTDKIHQLAKNKFVDVSFGNGTEVIRVIKITCGNKVFEHLTEAEATYRDLNFHNENSKIGTTLGYVTISSDKPVLVPAPAENIELYAYVSLRPSRKDGLIPKEILEEYEEVILAGAKADILRMPARPWSNDTMSIKFWSREFLAGVQKASAAIGVSNSDKVETINMECGSY